MCVRIWVRMVCRFAKDQGKFFADFASVWVKMQENGQQGLKPHPHSAMLRGFEPTATATPLPRCSQERFDGWSGGRSDGWSGGWSGGWSDGWSGGGLVGGLVGGLMGGLMFCTLIWQLPHRPTFHRARALRTAFKRVSIPRVTTIPRLLVPPP